MGVEQGSDTIGGRWGGKGPHEQHTKIHGLLITKTRECTSGGKRDLRWFIDIFLDKTESHNKKNYSLFKAFFIPQI